MTHTPITVPTTIHTSVIKKGIKPVDPPQNVATSHLRDPISTTTNLDEAYPLGTSCDHLLHLDSPSLSSELQDNSSVHSVEIEFLPESEGQLDHTKLTEFRQPLQVQSHLEMPRILVQLGHTQRT